MRDSNYLIIFLLILLSTISCEKDKDEKDENPIKKTTIHLCFNSDGVELSRAEMDYDSQGRMIGKVTYADGIISSRTTEIVYNQNEMTYVEEIYTNGLLEFKTKSQIMVIETTRSKISVNIKRNSDGSELYNDREETTYDTNGRENHKAFYDKGILVEEHINYNYNGKELTYVIKSYGRTTNTVYTRICKIDYYDYKFQKMNLNVLYESNRELSRSEYTYDEQGRMISLISYYSGKETYRTSWTYDTIGRKKSYEYYFEGILQSRDFNYVYKTDETTYSQKRYNDHGENSYFYKEYTVYH